MQLTDFIGKTVTGIHKDGFELTLVFDDHTQLIATAQGYEGTRLEVCAYQDKEELVRQVVRQEYKL